ncbi:glutamate synthase [NADH] [Apophysomyces sp. BC1034]|nr:glutamate synthase [NADH] [Apophysomyces sp. BC1015]KAG0178601.1 glutamate synthase [NADH] [Apophysomyces sp. BC1021]KAG0188933.1 glutamate synthase [NADH] [Apophysomyces sp. BC1034]
MSTENKSWASAIPVAQGLYNPEFEKDACGVGFMVHVKGHRSHKILSDASNILCNMTHRGASGADIRDGDGAGVMTGIPHQFFVNETSRDLGIQLPAEGQYAVGNLFMKGEVESLAESKKVFEDLASALHLKVLGWRAVPRDSTIIGPAAKSKEPAIEQPFVVLDSADFDEAYFERQLYVLRKHATHTLTMKKWFYVCSLSNKNIVYKGQLTPKQVYQYFHDLNNVQYTTHFALVHSRFSTNTFPSWDRAQPMRWCAHNGEINTLRGNKNWMRSREGVMTSDKFGDELELLYPIIEEGGSDSAAFDNVLELLVINGVLTLPEAVMMMIPEAWQNNDAMAPEMKDFYRWAASLMEPWDGPALFTFSDGRYCGASLDRNGLRPCRFYVTSDDIMICASEVGTVFTDPETIVQKGRLQPGRMLLVDTVEGVIVDDKQLKRQTAAKFKFGEWLKNQKIALTDIVQQSRAVSPFEPSLDSTTVHTDPRLKAFGYTLEQLNLIMIPMASTGKEALGSMGNDTALACLAEQPRLIYEYFRELFAQVTNPPIDPIREEIVMSLECYVGPEGNILEIDEKQCHKLTLPSPILSMEELAAVKSMERFYPSWKVATIDITFAKAEGVQGYLDALERTCRHASEAIDQGFKAIVLSDRAVSADRVAISSLIAVGGVHHHLVRNKQRSRIALMVETAEAREVHHFCVLLGYGADAVCPYLTMEAMMKLCREGAVHEGLTAEKLIYNFKKGIDNGILKVMSKMGISTLASYKGAQIFEALGVDDTVISRCFAGTASRIKGVTFDIFAHDALTLHESGFPSRNTVQPVALPESGEYHWRNGGEPHIADPTGIANLQDAVRQKNQSSYDAYTRNAYEAIKKCTLRGMLEFDYAKAKEIPIDQVEPWNEIVKRFVTGAMSYGSISMEAHSSLAIAMNKIGGKSNTGEGGEKPERSIVRENGDSLRSAIKQVASGRFGVTSFYLSDSDELQIKMAQGAKPGEGGELAGGKVSEEIASTRKTTPGIGLISPPPHHDIYSIEDLKQLIYDLKCANPRARVSVKLVSEVGVGIVASGVAKARADHILISGHDGGTGASRWTGIKYAGLPWELGLAETHQTLVLNDLRGRVIVQTDGQIKTGRDIAVACLLGAEEWGFATTPLIALGCTMMRKCHLNTCPVGIATQDPELRKKFDGEPEHVVNFFYYLAEELRGYMAKLGFRSINEMVGRAEFLKVNDSLRTYKTANLDLSPILTPAASLRPGVAGHCVSKQKHNLHIRLDNYLIEEAEAALTNKERVVIDTPVLNTDRALGTTLSYQVSKRHGEKGLPSDTIHVRLTGSAGQSLGAFLAPGIFFELEGDANDYVGKGLSGGKMAIYPPKNSVFKSEENVIVGNVCLYGATSGSAFFRGMAAERFCVRNSGASAVCEGVGDHGCEYMTGGRVVILGSTGRNFAAGMSGGITYVLDLHDTFKANVNTEMVELETVNDDERIAELRELIEDHHHYTGSEIAHRVLQNFNEYLPKFVMVMPTEYRELLMKQRAEKLAALQPVQEQQQPCKRKAVEPSVDDLEDSVMDEDTILKRRAKLDKVKGFMKYKRRNDPYRNAKKRTNDWEEINNRLSRPQLHEQAARCMDCGVPFCQSETGCPIGNVIPKWNELVYKDNWKDALDRLMMTNNFPEFTGRVCPAPCEGACVLGISEPPVAIKSIECAIIDRGFDEGWIVPRPPVQRTGKKVAIIGSGPAGLAAADQLNKAGHLVTVYDRNDRMGGLLMYGIPNMKLDKKVVQRRIDLLAAEGITFVPQTHVGGGSGGPVYAGDISSAQVVDVNTLKTNNDALIVATGATWPRNLEIPGRELDGIHYAMEFLHGNTKSLLDHQLSKNDYLSAKDKHVIVIGGGDTGNDCIGTSVRHGCKSVVNFELLPQPPVARGKDNPWPQFPRVFKVDYGHSEVQAHFGKDPREYCVLSKEFVSDGEGNVKGIKTVRVEWTKDANGRWLMNEVAGSEQLFEADLILLSMGFLGPEEAVIKQLSIKQDMRKNIETPKGKYSTSAEGVFAAGDCRRGQSLIVWGINEGRQCAREVDQFLVGNTYLPVAGGINQRSFKSNALISARA